MRLPNLLVAAATLLLCLPLASCGSHDDPAASESTSGHAGEDQGDGEAEKEAEGGLERAADQNTCLADAEPVAEPYADGFPEEFVFPPQTTVYDVEDRGDTGVIVTAVSGTPFREILDFLNHDEVDAGFAITEGETEEHDAEANWRSDEQAGRWAIRESAQCEGETVIQVLASPAA